jgi:Leucine-rich repeat (LRR) protein
VDEQSFGPGIAHLRIENAGEIRLGPNALRARGLQQLESITISDTRIVELDRTAFNGIPYLFAVNLTRNGLQDIHPNTFQNNTQLSLLTISGNPLRHTQDSKSTKHYLLHAPSVTDFDFSNNGILRLKRTAFSKMHSLSYINLRGNKLREIDSNLFDSLDSLMEVDLSDNLLNELPIDLFENKEVQTLRIAGRNDDQRIVIDFRLENKHKTSRVKVIAQNK